MKNGSWNPEFLTAQWMAQETSWHDTAKLLVGVWWVCCIAVAVALHSVVRDSSKFTLASSNLLWDCSDQLIQKSDMARSASRVSWGKKISFWKGPVFVHYYYKMQKGESGTNFDFKTDSDLSSTFTQSVLCWWNGSICIMSCAHLDFWQNNFNQKIFHLWPSILRCFRYDASKHMMRCCSLCSKTLAACYVQALCVHSIYRITLLLKSQHQKSRLQHIMSNWQPLLLQQKKVYNVDFGCIRFL